MRHATKFLAPALSASMLIGACGGSSPHATGSAASTPAAPASGSATPHTTVRSAANAKLGATVLVNADGLTLYRLSGERAGRFICTSGACLQAWHPLTAAAGAPPRGVGSLGVVRRPDGTAQIAYKGMPLYTFANDMAPGDANGQNLKDAGTWDAVSVGASTSASTSTSTSGMGAAPAAKPKSSAPSGSAAPAAPSSSNGYGY